MANFFLNVNIFNIKLSNFNLKFLTFRKNRKLYFENKVILC